METPLSEERGKWPLTVKMTKTEPLLGAIQALLMLGYFMIFY